MCTLSRCLVHAMPPQSTKIKHLPKDASAILRERYLAGTFSVVTQCFRAPGYCLHPSGRAGGRADKSIIFHWSFLPEASFGLRVLSLPASVCVCVSVWLCVNHLLVRAITRDLFKLGSPNLDQRCIRPWLRSLLFLGPIELDLQGPI